MMKELCRSDASLPTPREKPTNVRVQSTLVPNELQRKEAYHEHEVRGSDSLRSLAIKYRVSVSTRAIDCLSLVLRR